MSIMTHILPQCHASQVADTRRPHSLVKGVDAHDVAKAAVCLTELHLVRLPDDRWQVQVDLALHVSNSASSLCVHMQSAHAQTQCQRWQPERFEETTGHHVNTKPDCHAATTIPSASACPSACQNER
jgi:hypothetical protein